MLRLASIVLASVLALVFTAGVVFAEVSHPLTQVTPKDADFDMSSYNITNVAAIGIGTAAPKAELDIQGGSVIINGSVNFPQQNSALTVLRGAGQSYGIYALRGLGSVGYALLMGPSTDGLYADGAIGVMGHATAGYGGYMTGSTAGVFARSPDSQIAAILNGSVGIGNVISPAVMLDVDQDVSSTAMRIRGASETTEIADFALSATGYLIMSLVNGADTYQYFDFMGADDNYGMIIRESDGTALTPYANLYVANAAPDYMHIVVNAATGSTTGLVITDDDRVGIGTKTPSRELEVAGSGLFNMSTGRIEVRGTGTASIELREPDGSGVPYIRFANDAVASDAEIFLASDTVLQLWGAHLRAGNTGTINYATSTGELYASADLEVDGTSQLTYLGINNAGLSPVYAVDAYDNANSYVARFWSDGGTATQRGMLIGAGSDTGVGTNILISWRDGDGTVVGNVSLTGSTVTYGAFTGVHNMAIPEEDNEAGYNYGTLMCITETLPDPERPKQPMYKGRPCEGLMNNSVFGAYFGKHQEQVVNDSNLHLIAALGDGHMLVTDEGGDIGIGDYLVSSSRTGYAMKQDDDMLSSYTAAKATDNVDWSQVAVDPEKGFKWKLLSVTYHAG